MRGMSGHTVPVVTQTSLWHPQDPFQAGFLWTEILSRVAVLGKSQKSAQTWVCVVMSGATALSRALPAARRALGRRTYTKYKTLIEPFRIRMVQALDMPSEEQRATVSALMYMIGV